MTLRNDIVTYDLKRNAYQLLNVSYIYRSPISIWGKIETRVIKGKECLVSIDLHLRRDGGVVNFTLNKVDKVLPGYYPSKTAADKVKVTEIQVQLKAFKKDSDKISHSLKQPFELVDTRLIHLVVQDKIKGVYPYSLNKDDEDQNWGEICLVKITG